MYSFAIELSAQKKKDNTYALQLRVTKERKHKRISLSFCVTKDQFTHTSKKGEWIVNHPKAEEWNTALLQLIERVDKAIEEKRKTLKPVTLEIIANLVKNRDEESFLKFSRKAIETYNTKNHYRTHKRYETVINKLTEYRDSEDLLFHELTPRLLKSYRIYLQGLGNSDATIFNDLACIRVMVNKAVKENYLPLQDNPFLKLDYKLPKKSKPVYLTKEELLLLNQSTLELSKQETLATDAFLFALYMGGLKFQSLVCAKWTDVSDGKLAIATKQGTTYLRLHEKALNICKKYQQKTWSPSDYLFPILTEKNQEESDEELKKQISSKNAIINRSLKSAFEQMGINKKVSFFSARHTFAALASKTKDELHTISVVLGHTNVGQTALYLKQFTDSDEDTLLKDTFY